MKYIVYTLACALLFVSCNEKTKVNKTTETLQYKRVKVDTLVIKDFKVVFQGAVFDFPLTKEEMNIADSLLLKSVENYNKENKPINLRNYVRQYVVSLNNSGKKIITIYGSCSINGDLWRRSLLSVKDGGDCYFEIEINLTDKIAGEVIPHGTA